MKWYGSLDNRLEENKMFVDEIRVGTGVTEYGYSDRHPYEVIAVQDQKHFMMRKLDHIPIGKAFSNDWKLVSNENNATIEVVKRGKYWYQVKEATLAMLQDADVEQRLWLAMNGFDPEVIKAKGKQVKYFRLNLSIGKSEYYYDYEF